MKLFVANKFTIFYFRILKWLKRVPAPAGVGVTCTQVNRGFEADLAGSARPGFSAALESFSQITVSMKAACEDHFDRASALSSKRIWLRCGQSALVQRIIDQGGLQSLFVAPEPPILVERMNDVDLLLIGARFIGESPGDEQRVATDLFRLV